MSRQSLYRIRLPSISPPQPPVDGSNRRRSVDIRMDLYKMQIQSAQIDLGTFLRKYLMPTQDHVLGTSLNDDQAQRGIPLLNQCPESPW